jgi:hypothetical protein
MEGHRHFAKNSPSVNSQQCLTIVSVRQTIKVSAQLVAPEKTPGAKFASCLAPDLGWHAVDGVIDYGCQLAAHRGFVVFDHDSVGVD